MKRTSILPSFKKFLRNLCRDERGSLSPILGIAAIPVFAAAGVAIDFNRTIEINGQLQAIADSASLAGAALDVTPELQKAASIVFLEEQKRDIAGVDYSYNVTTPTGKVQVVITGTMQGTFLPVAINVGGLQSGDSEWSKGNANLGVVSRANFLRSKGSMVCMLTLNETAQNAMYFSGSGNITATKCGFQSNSNHAEQALHLQGSAVATADFFNSVGGWDITGNRASFSTPPVAGVAPFEEPFKLNVACPAGVGTDITIGTSTRAAPVSLTQSIYRNIIVRNNKYAAFTPGIHYIKGEVTMTGGLLSGTGVTIVLCGPAAKLNMNGGALAIEAPKTGTYAGFAIIGDASATSQQEMQGGADTYIRGIMYTPKAGVRISGNSDFNVNSKYFPLISDYVTLTGSGKVNIDSDYEAYGFTLPQDLMVPAVNTVWLDR
jgi:Flp pilus assembly protein TadG